MHRFSFALRPARGLSFSLRNYFTRITFLGSLSFLRPFPLRAFLCPRSILPVALQGRIHSPIANAGNRNVDISRVMKVAVSRQRGLLVLPFVYKALFFCGFSICTESWGFFFWSSNFSCIQLFLEGMFVFFGRAMFVFHIDYSGYWGYVT